MRERPDIECDVIMSDNEAGTCDPGANLGRQGNQKCWPRLQDKLLTMKPKTDWAELDMYTKHRRNCIPGKVLFWSPWLLGVEGYDYPMFM